MNDLEERLRAVTRAAAGQIPPERIPPLRAPAPGRFSRAVPGIARLTGGHSPRWRRWQARLAPVVAAVAVVGLVAASLTLAHAIGGHQAAPASPTTPGGGPPPYYVAMAKGHFGIASPGDAAVRSTATGAVITYVPQPRGEEYFGVSGASDDSTFVLGAETTSQIGHASRYPASAPSSGPARFYLLRFDAATRTAKVTPLSMPELPHVEWFTLSPDGTELAVFSATPATVTASVYSVASGAARTWTASTRRGRYVWVAGAAPYWVQGGRLAFWLGPTGGFKNVNDLLNTNTAGGRLLSSSRRFALEECGKDGGTQNGKLTFGSTWTSGPPDCSCARPPAAGSAGPFPP
jgi:hypothetical protein